MPQTDRTTTLRVLHNGDRLTNQLRVRLCRLRDAYGLSDAAWARAAQLRQQDVSRFTLGKTTYPPLDFLDALCRVFDRSLGQLLEDDSEVTYTGFTLTNVELEHIVHLRGMDADDRHAFQRLARPRPRQRRGSGR